jgi:hypothetical protein
VVDSRDDCQISQHRFGVPERSLGAILQQPCGTGIISMFGLRSPSSFWPDFPARNFKDVQAECLACPGPKARRPPFAPRCCFRPSSGWAHRRASVPIGRPRHGSRPAQRPLSRDRQRETRPTRQTIYRSTLGHANGLRCPRATAWKKAVVSTVVQSCVPPCTRPPVWGRSPTRCPTPAHRKKQPWGTGCPRRAMRSRAACATSFGSLARWACNRATRSSNSHPLGPQTRSGAELVLEHQLNDLLGD